MATINSRVIFVTTSPRTPAKMIPEIELLHNHFSGQIWNTETQTEFMELLKKEDFFHGIGEKDPAFSARDRINRAPKSLGFVVLKPTISLTPAGLELINSSRKEEIFLRQLLKFQIPSPYHTPTERAATFWVKPYLEIFRLVRHFGSLKFDELRLFGLQLTDYRDFDSIVAKIVRFRTEKAQSQDSYKKFYDEYLYSELEDIYADRIQSGEIKTRESRDTSVKQFLRTQSANLRDYADACFRYMRSTGLVNISQIGKSISIAPEKTGDVDFFLRYTERDPCHVDNVNEYINYLGNSQLPALLTDDRELLEEKIRAEFPHIEISETTSIDDLKELFAYKIEERKNSIITEQVTAIKDYRQFDDITTTYNQIFDKSFYDTPLMFEWNTWRAMTMLNGGEIKANLKFDDFGNPMSTAQGNMADIFCDYGDWFNSRSYYAKWTKAV